VKAALLDINILTALLWPAHEHHEAAHGWFGRRADARWATCSLTQLGFVRIVSNPAFSRDALTPVDALALLRENLAHPGHEFWTDSLQVPTAVKEMEARLQSYRQLSDAYLLAVAQRRNGVLATFDRGLRSLAGDALLGSLELVPTR
jgi:toxin-antitoxin system PIN domain toxin